MHELDLAFVRTQFPAFREPSLKGWAFFENAGGSYACRQVIERLNQYYRRMKVQPYAPYPAARMAGAWMDESYVRIAEWLCVEPDEVHFGPSTSQNTYVLAQAFRGHLLDGFPLHVHGRGQERREADDLGLVLANRLDELLRRHGHAGKI